MKKESQKLGGGGGGAKNASPKLILQIGKKRHLQKFANVYKNEIRTLCMSLTLV